jgi:phosphate transport system permease protein
LDGPIDLRQTLTRKSAVRIEEVIFSWLCRAAAWSSLAILAILVGTVIWKAWGYVDWQFLTSYDSKRPLQAGIWAGLIGTSWMIFLTFLMAIPIGVGAAIYLEEYARDRWIVRFIRVNISNLAGVPSIVYGILGLTVFVRMFDLFARQGLITQVAGKQIEAIILAGVEIPLPLGKTLIAGALTMSLLILPVIIVATQEALRAIPPSLRHASLALGATRWQTVRYQVLPAAIPGIMTSIILSISRAIGETAPLIVVGAVGFARFAPGGIGSLKELANQPSGLLQAPFDKYTVMPVQIFNWVGQAQAEFQGVAAAGILVLLGLLLGLNGIAIIIRNRYQKKLRW